MREKWNKKYSNMQKIPIANTILKRFLHLVNNRNRALDIACGLGHNAYYLAQQGFVVDAIDISEVALQKAIKHPKIHYIHADLTRFSIEPESYDLIINFNYLQRDLFPAIIKGLKSDGVVLFEAFTYHSDMNPHYCLYKNELLEAFFPLEIYYYRLKEGKAILVAIKN